MTTESLHPPYASLTVDVPDDPPAEDRVEVRIVSLDAEAARHVADALRLLFAGGEQRSYPALPSGRGTRLHLSSTPRRAPARSAPGWRPAGRRSTGRIRARPRDACGRRADRRPPNPRPRRVSRPRRTGALSGSPPWNGPLDRCAWVSPATITYGQS